MDFDKMSDKELIGSIIGGHGKAFKEFKLRYDKKLGSIFYRKFRPLEKSLSYSLSSLFEDFQSIVYSEVLSKPLKSLDFDADDSIGGLVHKTGNDRSSDMWTRSINHRSIESTEKRKQKKAVESNKKTGKEFEETTKVESFDYGFGSFEEFEIDRYVTDSPEGIKFAENLNEALSSSLSETQWKITEMMALKETQEYIAKELGLTKDQVRTQIRKIKEIVESLAHS